VPAVGRGAVNGKTRFSFKRLPKLDEKKRLLQGFGHSRDGSPLTGDKSPLTGDKSNSRSHAALKVSGFCDAPLLTAEHFIA
jgi:hypothetical protein